MRPSTLRKGDAILYSTWGGAERRAVFVCRRPSRGKGCPAVNIVKFPDYQGQDGPDDQGLCHISDYDLSRRGRRA